ncbi:hypothetical protein SAMN05216587_101391 [Selenomonas ruminantium]|uniref:Uncharacterized protein n=1 Tax=Selenomonas ruminantium TaxID=971 RepID=A0A1I0V8V3_SELRU|nr:hypothetical protein SAMN05216587_101391 [Selenomonas ruminantium]
MVPKHTRATVAHYFSYFFAFFFAITVNRTHTAKGLYVHARALSKLIQCVFRYIVAIKAQIFIFISKMIMAMAVNLNYFTYGM